MQIKFCGAARNVTGSSHLITLDNGYKILLDCGMFQGSFQDDLLKNNTWHFDPQEIDCLIVSHAHIDHIGRIPQLVKDGFKGCIHATLPTRSLSSIMLMDSALIQMRDAESYNKRVIRERKAGKRYKLPPKRVPLYTDKHAVNTMKLFVGYSYDRWHYISPHIQVQFRDQGHILGSASVNLRIKEGRKYRAIGFTGDIGRPDRPILRNPQQMDEVDYLICESTYGDREHESKPEQTEKLLDVIRHTCVEKGGKLIIPAFSVGRTQELVYMMDQLYNQGRLPAVPVYVDSPLAVDATDIYTLHPECYDEELSQYLLRNGNPFSFKKLHYVRNIDESKMLNTSTEPCVIISASGMMTAGRVRHHLFHNIEDPKCTFLLVGYASRETAAGLLKAGVTEIKVRGEMLKVNAEIKTLDSFSAHGDRAEMLDNITNQKKSAKEVFLVHGEYNTQQAFQEYLSQEGFKKVSIPDEGEVVVLK